MGANNSTIHSPSVFSFPVDNVKPCNTQPDIMSVRTAEEILKLNIKDDTKFEDFSYRGNTEKCFLTGEVPGFILALHTAFQSHYPLKLSVSDFILLIGQGLGRHINKNAEKLREHFVNHQGKENIKIHRSNFVMGQQNDWSTVFGDFAEQIKEKVKADVHSVVIDDTSVATPASRIASEIALMDCMQSYFNYTVVTFCGFPKISLEGTPEDWKKLQEKYNKLVEMNKGDCLGLNFWLKHLTPVIEKVCKTGIERKADASFWSNIYKYQGPKGSGSPYITGWCMKFFPYLAEDKVNEFGSSAKIDTSDIPKQMSQVPFVWEYFGTTIPMKIYGGFMGAHFNKDDMTVSPAHFWCVAYDDKAEKEK